MTEEPAGLVKAPNMFVHAVYVAALAFEDRRREDSHELYLTHALDVAHALGPDASLQELSTAVLHDVLEDTDWSKDDLADSGVEGTVLEAITTLTRGRQEGDEEFVVRICLSPGEVGVIAQRVKLADLTVNAARADAGEERERYERSIPIVRSALARNRGSDAPLLPGGVARALSATGGPRCRRGRGIAT